MKIKNDFPSTVYAKCLAIIFSIFFISGFAWSVDLQPGEKAQIYILLDFDGNPNFPSITWQHRTSGLNTFTGSSLAIPPVILGTIKQNIINQVTQDFSPFDNVHIVTDETNLNFWYTWGIDDVTYIFSNDRWPDDPDKDPEYFSPISRTASCPESGHSCGRLYGKAGGYQNPSEDDQTGHPIFQPLFARTFAGSYSIPSGGPSRSVPPVIFGTSLFPRGPGDIDEVKIATALANSAAHEVAHLFRVGHPPSNCDSDCVNDLMISEVEWRELRNNKRFSYEPGLAQLTHTLTTASTADSLEPNNTELTPSIVTAQQLTLTLHDPFDEDFIKYTVPPNANSTISFTVTHDFPVEDQGLRELLTVEVRKSNLFYLPGTVISSGWQFSDSTAATGDEYLIRVRQDRKRLPVQYRLQIGVGRDVYEQGGGNNSAATATPWPDSTVCDFSGLSIDNPSDLDYYNFNSQGGAVEVELIYDPTYGDLALDVDGNTATVITNNGIKRYGVNLEEHAPLAIYDTDQDVTWVRDTTASGKLNYSDAQAYVQTFNNNQLLGGTNWRLPTLDITSSCLEGSNCTDGELGHMYYTELGNQSGFPPTGGLNNRGPFANLDRDYYWYSTKDPVRNEPFTFFFINGFQTSVPAASTAYAWLLHDGELVPVTGSRMRHKRIVECGSNNSVIKVSGPPVNYSMCVRKIPAQAGCPGYVAWTPFSGSGLFNFTKQNPYSPGTVTVTGDIRRGMFARILSEDATNTTWQIAAWSNYGNDIGQPIQGTLVVPKPGTGSDGKFTGLAIAQSGLTAWYQKEGSCTSGRIDLVNCNTNAQCDSSTGSGDGVCAAVDISIGNYAGASNLIDSFDVSSGTDAMFWHVTKPSDRGTLTLQAGRDTDGDCIPDTVETATGTDPNNDDSDDDGLLDGEEDTNCDGIVDTSPGGGGSQQESIDIRKAETNPRLFDSDGDGLSDGLERGLIKPHGLINTQPTGFVADADPFTTTDPVNADTDGDGVSDGEEDKNKNGKLDEGETSPIVSDVDDTVPPYDWMSVIIVILILILILIYILVRFILWIFYR